MRVACLLLMVGSAIFAQSRLSPGIQPFESFQDRVIALQHVRVIDGTGRAPQPDQNIVIERGKITSVEAGSDVSSAQGVTIMDLPGRFPLPAKISIRVGEPIDLRERLGSRGDPDDGYRLVTSTMQRTLTRLSNERTLPVVV